MKIILLKDKKEFILEIIKLLFIILAPVLCLIFILHFYKYGGSRRFLMWDDNQRQWSPIINAALNQFFHGKGMPFYDFYNYNGFEIFDEGYYGLYNPVMWIAFLVGKLLCIEAIPMYIYLCIIFGNISVYRITKEFQLSTIATFFVVFAYTFSPTLFNMRWYYCWNNYFLMPLLIYSFLLWNKNSFFKNVLLISFTLALSIMSGNAQYTIMHFMCFGILSFLIICFVDKSFFKLALTSILLASLVCFPIIVSLFNATTRGRSWSETIFTQPIHPLRYLLFLIFPNFKCLKSFFFNFFLPNTNADIYVEEYIIKYLFLGFFVIFVILFLAFYKKQNNNEKNAYKTKLAFYCLICFLFWLIYIGGENFVIVSVLSHIPILKEMKNAYKPINIMTAVLLLPACIGFFIAEKYLSDSSNRNNKIFAKPFLYFLCLLLIFVQVYECACAIKDPLTPPHYVYFKEIKGIDTNNYRFLFISQDGEHFAVDTIPYANMNVSEKIQTVGGYDTCHGFLSDSMLAIYCDNDFGTLTHSNAIQEQKLLSFFDANSQNIQKFINGLSVNSVKYLMSRNTNLKDFAVRLSNSDFSMEQVYCNQDNGVLIYEINGIPTIARSETGLSFNIENLEMDEIKIKMVDTNCKKIILNERFNKNLKAYYVLPDDKKENLVLSEANGSIEISLSNNNVINDGYVIVKYENKIYSLGVVITAVFAIIIIMFFTMMIFTGAKQNETIDSNSML